MSNRDICPVCGNKSFSTMFYTIYKAPVLLNIGFGNEENINQTFQNDCNNDFDYYIDTEFDINTFCKTVHTNNAGQQQV